MQRINKTKSQKIKGGKGMKKFFSFLISLFSAKSSSLKMKEIKNKRCVFNYYHCFFVMTHNSDSLTDEKNIKM